MFWKTFFSAFTRGFTGKFPQKSHATPRHSGEILRVQKDRVLFDPLGEIPQEGPAASFSAGKFSRDGIDWGFFPHVSFPTPFEAPAGLQLQEASVSDATPGPHTEGQAWTAYQARRTSPPRFFP